MSRHRNYVFTFNNPPEHWQAQSVFENSSGNISYIAGQFEIGDSGTRHFQGLCTFSNPQGLPGCRRLLDCPTGHFEPRKGTHTQALDYCTKEESRVPGTEPQVHGTPPAETQGGRSDLLAVRAILSDGGSLADVAEFDFGSYLRYQRGLASYANLVAKHRHEAPVVYYFYGQSGVGKSKSAWSLSGDSDRTYAIPLSAGNNVWFDGYVPGYHDTVIFDDYYHNFRFSFLLQLLDRYPIQVPVKGGFVKFNSPRIVFTSNISLDSQYPNIPDAFALWRRIKHVICMYEQYSVRCTPENPKGLFLH